MLQTQSLRIDEFGKRFSEDPLYGKAMKCHKLIMAHLNRLDLDPEKHRVLDIGCGRGVMLHEFRMRGFLCDAVEPCGYLLENDLSEFDVYPYFVKDLHQLGDASYDIVICINVADHLLHRDEARLLMDELDRLTRYVAIFCVNADRSMQSISAPWVWWHAYLLEGTKFRVELIFDPWNSCNLALLWKINENSACDESQPCEADPGQDSDLLGPVH